MAAPLTWDDLKVFDPEIPEDLANAMIASVWAQSMKVAPCLKEDGALADEDDAEIVKSTLRRVIMRWFDAGSGAVSQRGAAEYQETLRDFGGGKLRPDDIKDLQSFCATTLQTQAAQTIPTRPVGEWSVHHAAWCNTRFSNNTDIPTLCDCGAELTWDGYPLWPDRPTP